MVRPLRSWRIDAGLTQEQLAERAALNPATINEIEQGKRPRSYPSTRKRIANVLGCLPSEIAEFADGDSRGVPPDQHR